MLLKKEMTFAAVPFPVYFTHQGWTFSEWLYHNWWDFGNVSPWKRQVDIFSHDGGRRKNNLGVIVAQQSGCQVVCQPLLCSAQGITTASPPPPTPPRRDPTARGCLRPAPSPLSTWTRAAPGSSSSSSVTPQGPASRLSGELQDDDLFFGYFNCCWFSFYGMDLHLTVDHIFSLFSC